MSSLSDSVFFSFFPYVKAESVSLSLSSFFLPLSLFAPNPILFSALYILLLLLLLLLLLSHHIRGARKEGGEEDTHVHIHHTAFDVNGVVELGLARTPGESG